METDEIPAYIKRKVWKRDGGKFGYVAESGRECGATEYVQHDHIIPRALGGTHEPENLRLRCGSHNRLHAEEVFGREKMAGYAS